MKVIKLLVLVALMSFGFNEASAQVKMGHIDVNLLVSLMPEAKKASSQLETMGKGFESDYQKMVTEFQNLQQKYQNEASQQSEAMNQTRAKELQDKAARIQTFQETAQKELAAKSDELMAPVFKKAQDAIDAVAKEKGLNYVVNASLGVLVYDDGSLNIIEPVKKKLGIQ